MSAACKHSHGPVVGGVGQPKEPTKEDQALLDKVKEEFVKKCGINPSKFQAILVSKQVVAGTNYFYKVDVGGNNFYHLRVFQPLPNTNEGPSLVSFQANKKKNDRLEHF